ncbi:hypothetical protein EV183_003511 [Coemansia sp. RSA 2336]|nr:hypothetical protein EV183_003511 [Coemansia sp. RSA 2336]
MTPAEQHPRKRLRSNGDQDDWPPTRVLGSNLGYSGFRRGIQSDRLFVDKTLLCKALFDSEATVVCVSTPPGFGKVVNTDIIEKFFDVLTLEDMKDSASYSYQKPSGPVVPETARASREKLFEQTLLQERHPEFVKHFCRYPVMYINFMVTQYDSARPEYVYKRLVWSMLSAVKKWIDAFDCSELSGEQRERYEALAAMESTVSADIRKDFKDWQQYEPSPKALFDCLSDFVASISSERYIIIAEKCDDVFIRIQGKSWEPELRAVLLELFERMFKNNNRLLKAMLISIFAIPLDELGLDSSASIIPAFNNCFHSPVDYPLTSEQAIAAMFGFTSPEVCGIVSNVKLAEQEKQVLDYFGSYSFGYKDGRFSSGQVMTYLFTLTSQKNQSTDHYKSWLRLLRHFNFTPHDSVKSIVRKASPELLLLLLRLIGDYDHGGSSCFIWPSAEIKDQQHSQDELSNLVVDLSTNPGNTDAESSVDKIATLLVFLGYLTVGHNNALRIPNNAMRDMWENLRLLATFNTQLQVEQYDQQHELISSLFNGETDTICSEFTSLLEQITADSRTYAPHTQLEYMCRVLMSKLTIMRYMFEHRPAGIEYDARFLADPQFDTPWIIKLQPFGRYTQALTVKLCFRNIATVQLPNEQAAVANPSSEELSDKPQHDIQLNLAVLIDNNSVTVQRACN